MPRAAAALAWGIAALSLAGARPAPAIEGDYEAAVTRVPCKLTERLSSQDAKSGDRFAFDTTSSSEINRLFLPAGTHGHGFVRRAEAAHGVQPGVLALEARSLDLPDGEEIAVGLEPGQLDRPVARSGVREANVVYEKGTTFNVTAPPPATPAPGRPP